MSLESYKIPDNIVVFTNDNIESYVVGADAGSAIATATEPATSTPFDDFLNLYTIEYPKEECIENLDFTATITPNSGRYIDRNTQTIIINLKRNDIEFNVGVSQLQLLKLLSKTNVNHGVIGEKVRLGFSHGIASMITDTEYERIKGIKKEPKKVKTTTVYEVGRIYTSKAGRNPEVYLGKLYTHLKTQDIGYSSEKTYTWLNKPIPVYLFLNVYYISRYDSKDSRNLEDIYNYIKNDEGESLRIFKDNIFKYSLNRILKVPTDKILKMDNYSGLFDLVSQVKQVITGDKFKDKIMGFSNYDRLELFNVLAISDTEDEQQFEDMIGLDKLKMLSHLSKIKLPNGTIINGTVR